MKVKALIPFTMRDASTGKLTSIACGAVATVTDAIGNQLISDGLAEAYTLISPTGSTNITENDTYDVTAYASAVVNVPNPSTGTLEVSANGTFDVTEKASVTVNVVPVTVTYNVNGGTGTVDSVTVGKGTSVNLDDGSGITAPENKQFAGWATASDATEADVESPYTVTADVTLYAVWSATE